MEEQSTTETSFGIQKARPLRVGLVATDALRVEGLRAIVSAHFEGEASGLSAEIVPLSIPGVLQDPDLSVVMIDASCTNHLFELLVSFRRVRPQVRVIVIGDSQDSEYIQQVIGAGAKGYLPQSAKESEIRMALQIVSDGSIWAPRKVLSRLLDASSSMAQEDAMTSFTPRELEVLTLLVTGMTNRQIATDLGIDEGTVKAHLSRLMRKVGATNRIELTMQVLKRDLARA